VILDVGETLIEETRIWAAWADELAIPRLTFMAAMGAAIERGDDFRVVFDVLGVPDWRARAPEVEVRHGGFSQVDLYPDALETIDAIRAKGARVAIVANQPAIRADQLRSIGVAPDVMAMSEALGVSKPDPAFFTRALELIGNPLPADVAYVGDRVDNDVLPARRAGMRPVWLRRGPWGVIQSLPNPAGVLILETLEELVGRWDELWIARDDGGPEREPGSAAR
jgi:HAD superfamily hydrolase (TIGR01509 family)